MTNFKTIENERLARVAGGFDHAAADAKGQNWALVGGYAGAAAGAVVIGLSMGTALGGVAVGGLAGSGLGYAGGYLKGAWDTRKTASH